MHGNDNAQPGVGLPAGASSTSSCLSDSHHFTPDRETRHQADCIHALGRKGLSYLLHEIKHDPTNAQEIIERFARTNAALAEASGGRDWLELRNLLRVVR
jgi:hypothetical protein